ncbi:MAG TPA: hypothetical protein VFD07_02455 [Candidatus Krumholzibacteria bacterium]|nr:hypothetical protein [Candidatus Krumholzibacteria bacterium]
MDGRRNEQDTGAKRTQRARLLLGSLAILCAGCATNTAPPGWLPDAEEIQSSPHGAWVTIRLVEQREGQAFHGELIAMHPDSIFMLNADGLLGFPSSDVDNIKVTFFDIDAGPALWTTVGAVSAVSHGWYGVFTLPIWIFVGGSTSASYSHAAEIKLPRDSYAPGERAKRKASSAKADAARPMARSFARFPGGLPANLDRTSLRWTEFPHEPRPPTNWSPADPPPR